MTIRSIAGDWHWPARRWRVVPLSPDQAQLSDLHLYWMQTRRADRMALLLAGTVALPVSVIVVGTVVVAVAVGYGLDWIDKKTHTTEHVTSWFRSIGESMKHAAEYLEKSMPKDYDQYPMMYMP
jgi:hypothetical protein